MWASQCISISMSGPVFLCNVLSLSTVLLPKSCDLTHFLGIESLLLSGFSLYFFVFFLSFHLLLLFHIHLFLSLLLFFLLHSLLILILLQLFLRFFLQLTSYISISSSPTSCSFSFFLFPSSSCRRRSATHAPLA